MDGSGRSLADLLTAHGVSRRAFLQFSTAMAGVLALPRSYGHTIAQALTTAPRVPVIWLEGQDCAGNTEGMLRASHPTTAQLILDILSLDYHETIMAPAGVHAEKSKDDTMAAYHGKYICVVEGSIPVGENGAYCTIAGRAFSDIAQQTMEGALATIAVGSCAFDGGLPGASGGPTGAIGAKAFMPSATVINLPGCPMNVQNLTATIVYYLTFGSWPAVDASGRPLFAYGQLIHDQCERRAHFDAGEFVTAWGDEASLKGWCLYKMGCKGPETLANCPTARFNDGTSWPVKSGHGCVGCTMPAFWDQMSPFYRRLPAEPPQASSTTADQLGLALVGVVAGASAVHGVASYARKRRVNGHATSGPGRGGGGAVAAAPDGGAEPGATVTDAVETMPLADQYQHPEGTER
jgi:hydrogenase small subunit